MAEGWGGCACCPPNLARTVASVGKYAFTRDEDTFWIHLYIGAVVTAGEYPVKISSGFPWDGHVKLEVLADMPKQYCFGLRIPGWCGSYEISGVESAERWVRSGYLYIRKEWKKGDEIRIHFPMSTDAIVASPLVREDTGKAAVRRGPVIYCMEEADNGKKLHLLEMELPLQADVKPVLEMGRKLIRIDVSGKRCKLSDTPGLYQKYKPEIFEKTVLRYIPYFCWNNRGEGEMQVWTRYREW